MRKYLPKDLKPQIKEQLEESFGGGGAAAAAAADEEDEEPEEEVRPPPRKGSGPGKLHAPLAPSP